MTTTARASRALPQATRSGLVLGGIAFAAAGSPVWGEPELGSPTSVAQVAVAVIGGALLLVGVVGLGRSRPATSGRLGRWGTGLVVAGLAAHLLGSALGGLAPTLPAGAADVVAVAAIPAWALAHLAYVGTTLIGVATWRSGALPRPVSALLVACAPLVLAGVPASLALEPAVGSGVSAVIAWIATEGQLGLGWLLVGVTGRRPGADDAGAGSALEHSHSGSLGKRRSARALPAPNGSGRASQRRRLAPRPLPWFTTYVMNPRTRSGPYVRRP
ncbi:hypothetical protein Bcav_0487 [Beutenbergia cavernae DSM 12333]|uniref:Uncharacterized protein n=1 Tax=Beutenbergia cavernae (strain ATCC BAA-8 / DSM 12333 / CCUG 43141 / JCM 11478 / NBRC 16432 / NCIMB 13614 / HKI 0122) TaxID=471853 RepID=C5BX75_BEUC1|nr:hypothetical protein [Beutenbergia cavernae]ACQ78750.1 hypothetical protein Bcav_0487 [Beutenbergia cavernae DSM 12333]